jgi:7-cyano-7-deazaguanine synthase
MSDPVMTVCLLSGGIDSTALAAMLHSRRELAACLFVLYGQPACGLELKAAQDWCDANDVELHTVQTTIPGAQMSGDPGDPCIVPARNLILGAFGATLAHSIGATRVALGANLDDQDDYYDCRPYFAGSLTAALQCADLDVTVWYPFAGLGKAAILQLAAAHSVDIASTFSCYTPAKGKPCGACASCCERAKALEVPE